MEAGPEAKPLITLAEKLPNGWLKAKKHMFVTKNTKKI